VPRTLVAIHYRCASGVAFTREAGYVALTKATIITMFSAGGSEGDSPKLIGPICAPACYNESPQADTADDSSSGHFNGRFDELESTASTQVAGSSSRRDTSRSRELRISSLRLAMTPRRLYVVIEKLKTGYLGESLTEFRRVYDEKIPSDRVLMAELLVETEGPEQIRGLVEPLVELAKADPEIRARACATLAVALRRQNRLPEAVRLLERAVRFATSGNDPGRLCRMQLLLLIAKFDLFGPASLGTLPVDIWRSALTAGDPVLFALIHCRIAGLEGRRGAFDLARRHLDLGIQRLEQTENPYVEGLICNVSCTVAAVAADPIMAMDQAERALQLSIRSGDRYTQITAINNLCHVSILLGRMADAERYLAGAEKLVRNDPFFKMCLCENRAHIQLLAGRLDECEMTLGALMAFYNHAEISQRSYAALEAATTHARLLRRQGHFEAALEVARTGVDAAHERHLPLLEVIFGIHCSDALVDLGRTDEATQSVGRVARTLASLGSDSLTVRAELERVRGRVLSKLGAYSAAHARFDLSISMHEATGQRVARDEALRCRDEALRADARGEVFVVASPMSPGLSEVEGAGILLSIASRADLLGMKAFELVSNSNVTSRTALLAKGEMSVDLVQHHDWPNAADERLGGDGGVLSIDLGTYQDKLYQLLIEPAADVSGASRLAAFEAIIRAAVGKEEARRERLQRTSVWPKAHEVEGDGPLVGSQRMREVYREAIKVAGSDLTVLLTGETGVGKEILAREIHRLSRRAAQDFRPVVCAGIASSVLESQLFGYRKGSFTGAVSDFLGVIRGAQGGTLFLDEIGELTGDLQIKLLRFLDSKEVHGLGELEPAEVDVRIIAATNANLSQLVEDRKFREDLLYRLSVATFNIPPLRERREEIPSLVEHFLARYAQQNRRPIPKLSDEALEHLLLYRWPGNVRQLRNEMERLAGIIDPGGTIRPRDLKADILAARRTQPAVPGPDELFLRLDQPLAQATDEVEREMIRRALNGHKGNLDGAARALGITRKGLYHKRQRLGML
jgi:transcriptional regulator with PAS, ATPase and Fis domain